MRSSTLLLWALAACGSAPAPAAPIGNHPEAKLPTDAAGARAYFPGTWTSAAGGYAAAQSATDAIRITRGGRGDDGYSDGVLENGTWGAAFTPTPNPGPSGPTYKLGWRIEEAGHLRLLLDGAEEDMPYAIETADRFRSGEQFFVRRR